MPDKPSTRGTSGVPDKPKTTQRDMTLINILERMVDQLHKQDALLQDALDSQAAISGAIENSVFHQNLQRDEIDADFGKLNDSFSRYRADMLSLVREQDLLRRNTEDILKLVGKLGYSFENAAQTVSDIDVRLRHQEKTIHDHVAYSNRKWEELPHELAETNRNVTVLHSDIEKGFGKIQDETHKQLEKYQRETTRRLLTLDGMMSALETLLIRTEPPEKKPPWPKRLIRFMVRFFKKIARGIRNLRFWKI